MDWHANLYLLDRRRCVMFCHDVTRFILFMAGLLKADFEKLDYWFTDLYANTLLKLGYEIELIEKALCAVDTLQFDTCCDRSVQGTMRVTAQDLNALLWQVPNVMDLPIYSTSANLNGRPITTKEMKTGECLWPHAEMRARIESI